MNALKEKILNTKVREGQFAMFYLGQVGFIFKYEGLYLMIDGFLTGPVIAPGKPFGRNYIAPIDPEDLDFIDLVLCTHDHIDHTDPRTLKGLLSVNEKAKFILPAGYAAHAVRDYELPADRVIFAHDGKTMEFGCVRITPVPSAHEELHQDENGDYMEMGYIFEFGKTKVYHSGDCCIYDGLKEKVGKADICMLPINGRSYYRLKNDIIGNMNLEEAIKFSHEAEAKLFVPLHFDLFPFNAVPPSFIPESVKMYHPDLPYRIFTPGDGMLWPED